MIAQQKNYVKHRKNTSTENADTFIREYKQKRWAQNSERIGKADSLSAWYSIEQMESFLDLAKSSGGNGIRFYYGAFPEDYVEEPEYAGRQTLVMIATKSRTGKDGAIANKDIYVRKNGRIKILSGAIPKGCPPICPPPSEGGMGDLGITIIDKGDMGMEIV
jgi:hypothetical protein